MVVSVETAASPLSSESDVNRIAGVAGALADAIADVVEKVKSSDAKPDDRAKFFGPLIGRQHAVLEASGIATFAEFELAARTVVGPAVTAATKRLELVEGEWRGILDRVEADANHDVKPHLIIGEFAPHFSLLEASGGRVSLADLLAEGPSSVLFVFNRHFG